MFYTKSVLLAALPSLPELVLNLLALLWPKLLPAQLRQQTEVEPRAATLLPEATEVSRCTILFPHDRTYTNTRRSVKYGGKFPIWLLQKLLHASNAQSHLLPSATPAGAKQNNNRNVDLNERRTSPPYYPCYSLDFFRTSLCNPAHLARNPDCLPAVQYDGERNNNQKGERNNNPNQRYH